MLDQEAAFAQIQEAKTMVEEDLQRRLEEMEGEREQLQKVAASAATLEQQLDQASTHRVLPLMPGAAHAVLPWAPAAAGTGLALCVCAGLPIKLVLMSALRPGCCGRPGHVLTPRVSYARTSHTGQASIQLT